MGEADVIPMLILSRAAGLLIVVAIMGVLYGGLLLWDKIVRWMEEKKRGANKEN